jgi:hypothetical protein
MSVKFIISFYYTKKRTSAWLIPLVVGLSYFFKATLAFGFFAFHFLARALYSAM